MFRAKSLPYILLLGFLYGSTLVVSRFSVGQYDPRTYIRLRMILAATAHLWVYAGSGLVGAPRFIPRNGQLWRRAAILGVLGTAIPMTSIVSSLQYQSSGMTSLLLTLNPAITVLLAQVFLPDEKLTARKIAGILIALGGAALLLSRGENGLGALAATDWRGYAWVGIGVLGSASAGIYARRTLRDENAWDVASIRMISAALALLPVTYLTVGYDLSRVNAAGYSALIYASLIGTFLGMWLSFYVIKRFGATVASQTSYVIPVVSTILGALVLEEVITPTMLVGMVIIFTGIALLNSRTGAAAPAALHPQAGD